MRSRSRLTVPAAAPSATRRSGSRTGQSPARSGPRDGAAGWGRPSPSPSDPVTHVPKGPRARRRIAWPDCSPPTTHRGSSRPAAGPSLHSHRGDRPRNRLRRDGRIVRRARAVVRAPLRRPPRPRARRARRSARIPSPAGAGRRMRDGLPDGHPAGARLRDGRRGPLGGPPSRGAGAVCGRALGAGRRRDAPLAGRNGRPGGLVRQHAVVRPATGPGDRRDRAGAPAGRPGPAGGRAPLEPRPRVAARIERRGRPPRVRGHASRGLAGLRAADPRGRLDGLPGLPEAQALHSTGARPPARRRRPRAPCGPGDSTA